MLLIAFQKTCFRNVFRVLIPVILLFTTMLTNGCGDEDSLEFDNSERREMESISVVSPGSHLYWGYSTISNNYLWLVVPGAIWPQSVVQHYVYLMNTQVTWTYMPLSYSIDNTGQAIVVIGEDDAVDEHVGYIFWDYEGDAIPYPPASSLVSNEVRSLVRTEAAENWELEDSDESVEILFLGAGSGYFLFWACELVLEADSTIADTTEYRSGPIYFDGDNALAAGTFFTDGGFTAEVLLARDMNRDGLTDFAAFQAGINRQKTEVYMTDQIGIWQWIAEYQFEE